MKNNIIPVFLLVFITAFLCGCIGKVKSPGISFASDKYNFGTIEEGKIVNHTFEFTNNGTGILIIEEIRPTCGCTVAGDYDKEVKPGQTGKIPIELDTSGFDGYQIKTIKVKTNVPGDIDYFILTIEGTVKVSVDVKPRKINFGDIERDRTAPLEETITISSRLPNPLKLTGLTIADDVTMPNVTLAKDNIKTRIKTLKDGFVYSLTITVTPPFQYGQVMGIIQIKTDSTIVPGINTQFSYHMEPLVKVFPNPLFVYKDQIRKGEEQLLNIVYEPDPVINSVDAQLYNNEVGMSIAGLSVNIDKVTVSLEEVERGRRYTIVLRFPKDFTFDPANTLHVTFKAQNVPDEPVFAIPVLGM